MKQNGDDIVVVVSAMGDTTDELLDLAQAIGTDLNLREMDMLLTTGEQQSAALLALNLMAGGCPSVSLNAWQAGIKTDDQHGKARITGIEPERIVAELD